MQQASAGQGEDEEVEQRMEEIGKEGDPRLEDVRSRVAGSSPSEQRKDTFSLLALEMKFFF